MIPILLALVISSVTPSSGPTAGGTAVIITGDHIGISHPRQVLFGVTLRMLPAQSWKSLDANTIEAVTPAYFPGPAKVTVNFDDGPASLSNAFTYTGEISDGFDRILLPVFTPPFSGAFGSQFVTFFSMWNTAPGDINVFALAAPPCQLGICPPNDPFPLTLRSREGAPAANFTFDGDPGRLLSITKDAFHRLAASLRVADVSRSNQTFGTRIPVVPESEFRSDFLTLIDVPMNSKFRSTVRIYSLDPGTSVHVRVIRSDSTAIYSEADVDLKDPADMFHPGYAQLPDFGVQDNVRIEITPNGKRIWAMASVTNNDTQQITIVAPH